MSDVEAVVGRSLDPFARAAERAFENATGRAVEITAEHAKYVRELLESLVTIGATPGGARLLDESL